MAKLILTLANGQKHKAILAETIKTMREYALRCGASFKAVTDEVEGFIVPHYRKLAEIGKALSEYDRVAWIDCDAIVSDLAPSIFDEVPETKLGIFNEAPWLPQRHLQDIAGWHSLTGETLPQGRYFNTGVIVASKVHAPLFRLPAMQINHYGEQTWFNSVLMKDAPKIHELSYLWNRMSCTWVKGLDPYQSHIVHFAGQNPPEEQGGLPVQIRNALSDWKRVGFKGGEQFFVIASGGLGNQIATLPTIHELLFLYPKAHIGIRTAYTEAFLHLESQYGERVRVARIENTEEAARAEGELLEHKYKFARVISTVGPQLDTMQMTSVDYHSCIVLGRQLHNRRIHFPASDYGANKIPDNCVVIHAGRNGWKSKDPGTAWYQAVLDGVKTRGLPVALIGKRDFKIHGEGYGSVDLVGADFDLQDLPLEKTAGVIRDGAFLLTNDSAPVHIAGGFDNHIGLLTIAKHPSLVFPHRPGLHHMDHAFTAPKGANAWELSPPKPFYRPDEIRKSVPDWQEGMQWPEAADVATYIADTLLGADPQ